MLSTDFGIASAAIVLHVLNYNLTAQVEHKTRVFTKGFGKNAVYIYAVYLVLSALVRDHFINLALVKDSNSMHIGFVPFSYILFFGGVALNLWTLSALGIKGMYNGDSFGFLMSAPVTTGPYAFMNEPQYIGTTACLLGSALFYQSLDGVILTAVMFSVFMISVELLEKPHMNRLYAKKK